MCDNSKKKNHHKMREMKMSKNNKWNNKNRAINKIQTTMKMEKQNKWKLLMKLKLRGQSPAKRCMLGRITKYDQFYLYTSQNILFSTSKLWKVAQIYPLSYLDTSKMKYLRFISNNLSQINTLAIYLQSTHPLTHYVQIKTSLAFSQSPRLSRIR